MKFTRRDFLQAAGAATVAGSLPTVAFSADNDIKLGSILDNSGNLDIYGKPMVLATRLAVDEINEAGGLLGRKIKLIQYDSQSDIALYTKYAQQLVREDKVDVVHGGITSASREAIRQTFRRSNTLYFYNVLYEGGVCDRNIFIDGVTPAHDTEVLVKHAMKSWGKTVYTLAADYNYGQITADWVKKYVQDGGGQVLGTEFFPLDATNFGSTISKIQAAKPDFIMTILVGGGPISFYRQFAAAGLAGKIPIASTTFAGSNEQLVLTAEESNGILLCKNYLEAIDTPVNKGFLKRFRARYGADYQPISDLTMSSYQGMMLWAEGVQKAGTLDRLKVIAALESGISMELPSGKMSIDPETHHCILDVHLAVMKNKDLVPLETFPQRKPLDTAAVCDLKKNPRDTKQYVIKVK